MNSHKFEGESGGERGEREVWGDKIEFLKFF